jgi:1A family penicillin-binding protein
MTLSVRLVRAIGGATAAVAVLFGLFAIGATLLLFGLIQGLPNIPEPLQRIIETPPTEIYAANGERLLQIGGRDYVPLDQIAPVLMQAILATEDHRFWDHHGINKFRTLKAFWITISGDRRQGASTITQQLAKNLFFSFEQTISRKLKELLVALQIESQFSKQEILEAYLNQIYFGPRAQGVAQAAHLFFDKPAAQLDLAEASLLAGLPKSPTRYNPFRHIDRAKARQRVVLNRMVAAGFISAERAASAEAQPLIFRKQGNNGPLGDYFVDWVLKGLEEHYGAQVVYHGGLKVTTTLDPLLQRLAYESLVGGLEDLEKNMPGIPENGAGSGTGLRERVQGALVAIQVNSGAVKAMVGGRDYLQSEFNRAVESNRQPGSGFKPFLYYTAFEKLNVTPATVLVDKPVRVPVPGGQEWRPSNFRREYQGPVILKKAFYESINTIAAQLVVQTGPEAVIATANRCGIESPLNPVYSVALGSSGVSPLEMASAFSTFAAGGVHFPAFGIWRVEDPYGQVLEEHIVSGNKALNNKIAYQVVDMMQSVVDEGTGEIVRRLGFTKPAAGKTGTTNGFKDAWFTGFTPALCASVWVGYDREQGMKDLHGGGITGGRAAAPIWSRFMTRATDGEPPRPFLQPAGIRFQSVDPRTGEPVIGESQAAESVALKDGE